MGSSRGLGVMKTSYKRNDNGESIDHIDTVTPHGNFRGIVSLRHSPICNLASERVINPRAPSIV